MFRIHRAQGPACLALLLCTLPSTQALAQHQHAHEHHATEPPRGASEEPRPQVAATGKPGVVTVAGTSFDIPDVELLDQDGRKVRFYSDVIKDRVVVVSFFFTSCDFICPMQGRALAKLQTELAERLGQNVFFVLVSKDPKTDTPERLRQWGAEFGAGRGWTLVTGPEDAMTKLLSTFTGEESPNREMHEPIFLIGNDRTGTWMEARSLAGSGELVKVIDRVSSPVVATGR